MEMPKARKKISPNILYRHRKFAPSYQLTIAFNRRWTCFEVSYLRKRHPARLVPTFMFTVIAIGRLASIALLVLLSTQIAAAERPTEQSPPALIVTPPTSMVFSGPKGGPFSPSLIKYRVSASTGTVRYSIRSPSWLTASSAFGVTDTNGVTITLTVNASASSLPPGAYGPAVAFTNVSNGQGSTTKSAKLIIRAPRPTGEIVRDGDGYLLDNQGGYLLDDRGGRLLAR